MCAPQGVMACGMGGGAKIATGASPDEREQNSKIRVKIFGSDFPLPPVRVLKCFSCAAAPDAMT